MTIVERSAYPAPWRARLTLVILLVAYIVSFIDRQILSLMVNPIRATLHISDFQIGLLQGLAFAMFFCFMGVPLGRLADRKKRKTIIIWGIVIWSVMTVMSGFANSFIFLFLFRMGVGVGEAALAPAGLSILSDSFPPDKLVRATSVFAQGASLGAGLSLLIGGQIIDYASNAKDLPEILNGFAPWQLTFVAVGLPGFLVAAIIMAFVKEPGRHGMTQEVASIPDVLRSFWRKRRDYAPLYICAALLAVVNFAAVVWFPTHLIRTFHFTPGRVGLFLGVIQLVGGVLGATLGSLVTEWGMRRGAKDAHLRTVILVSCLMAVTMVAPLMASAVATLAIWSVGVIAQSAYAGSNYAALQIISPNQTRAFNTATLILFANLIGLALGSATISGLAPIVFGTGPTAIGRSLAMVGFVCCVASAIFGMRSLPQYRSAVTRATAN
jgi:MFS family permease